MVEKTTPVVPTPNARPDGKGVILTTPCAESWYEEHRSDDSMVLLPLVGWGYKQNGTVVGLRPALVDAPSGFRFRGYVMGRQVYDYEMGAVPGGGETAKVTTYDNLFMQFQLSTLAGFKDQLERAKERAGVGSEPSEDTEPPAA